MGKSFKALARLLALFSAAVGGLLIVKRQMPGGFALLMPRVMAAALTPFALVAGAAGAVLGWIFGVPVALLAGLFGAVASMRYIKGVTARHDGFSKAFGPDWKLTIPFQRRARLPAQRWVWKLPTSPEPRRQSDLPFWTIPGTDRQLLCDIWQPSAGVPPTGLAFIYFHGSAWVMLDKDFGTRSFFRHLAGQGHVVMDVAYRLAPETGMDGMVGDVKRAVAWMKAHAAEYGVNPEHIVLGGASAGGHLAMLAAYAPHQPELTPDDVRDADLTVRAVVSEYGPTDIRACFYHTNQDKMPAQVQSQPPAATRLPEWLNVRIGKYIKRLGLDKAADAGLFKKLLGGSPDEIPDLYDLYSPVNHVHAGCPPTLLIQGEDDIVTSADATRTLHQKLVEAGVPAINVIFPQTDHAFDLALPQLSPAAQSALYDIDRFLALMAN